MIASALILLPLAIGTTPAKSDTTQNAETASALVDGGAWPAGEHDGHRRGEGRGKGKGKGHAKGHHKGKGHYHHGKGKGKGHHHGHHCGDDDPPPPAPVPSADFTFTPAVAVAGRDVTLDASASTGGVDGDAVGTIASWTWDFGDGASGAGVTAAHSYSAAGDYTVTLTVVNDYGETATASQIVSVVAAPVPVAAFSYAPPAPVGGAEIQFDATASTGGVSGEYTGTIVSYAWQFADGTTAEGATLTQALSTGDHAVTLTVTNDFGVSAEVTQTVHVVPPPPPYNPGGGGGGAPQTATLTVAPSALETGATSVSGNRLRVRSSIGFDVPDGSGDDACAGSVRVAGKARGVGTLRGRAALRARDGRCVAEFRHSLPRGAAGKRIKVVYSFAGNDAVAAWRASRTLKVRAPRR